ncbi:MAG: acetylornithine transaminase [Armatimonadetes bacterium]|nr:acetylornithine transaminase [Armatimonadota bacterium]
MTNQDYANLCSKYLMPTYRSAPVAFVRGEGAYLWDADGNRYLDFLAGIAVCSTGHCHPRVVEAIRAQAGTLLHTSNLYCIPLAGELARKLTEVSFADRCFLANSGAEANEAAIKLTRRWAEKHGRPGRVIITAENSFHGRTLATVTATGQEKYRKHFVPLPPGFRYVPYNDIEALRAACEDGQVCAVMLEPIQAEGGVVVPDEDYLPAVRGLCDELGILLILDEVQTGLGRTGRWFAYQHYDIEPDIMTLAKALGSGVPIGACLAREEVAQAFEPGDHASTFGGNYLACAAALATLEVMQDEGLVERAARMGEYLLGRLREMVAPGGLICGARGKGLLVAALLSKPRAREIERACRERGLLLNAVAEDKLRLAPPLIIGEPEVEEALAILGQVLAEIQ